MSNRSGYLPGTTPEAYLPGGAGAGAPGRSGKGYPPAPEPLPVPVMDNHTHFDFAGGPDAGLAAALAAALDAAEGAGVKGAIQVGTDLASSRFTAAAVDVDPRLLGAVAIHPNDAPLLAAEGALEPALEEIELLAAHPRIRAIGETGLDYFRTGEEGLERQQYSFRQHIDIAKRLGLALQIHDRDAHADVLRVLAEEGAPETVVFHCFSGDAELARTCSENGWYMSFSGTLTFRNSANLHEALAVADRDLLLVETDAPYLTPHPHRGRPNASYMVPYTVRFMAERLDADLAELGARLAANTERAYGSWDVR
ncbi:TatD family hydrolase [Arthrobacter sp. zg-Y750]|uniref:TatD family hydrolase n=1 Tax=Arthrobacter sp. zg-Y750 TaxID=2894189 RepID=UPI001E42E3CE|nr:TatD family hydrolase [Arthrobacter sp. zg-Y750]MCC9179042.1 TatD family hydrolase [Arthrobacter sp. zg-Y750]